jgi:hypothetical protein
MCVCACQNNSQLEPGLQTRPGEERLPCPPPIIMFARTSRSLLRPILRDIPKHTPIRTRASLHIQAAPSPRPRATAATPALLFRHRRRQQRTLHVLSTTADPSRPDLYYHLTQLPETEEPAYLLSLLSQLPDAAAHPDAPGVIGVLPAAASEGAEGQEEAGLNDFRENRAYFVFD